MLISNHRYPLLTVDTFFNLYFWWIHKLDAAFLSVGVRSSLFHAWTMLAASKRWCLCISFLNLCFPNNFYKLCRKVLACVVCGRLKSAFQIASRSGSVADVQYVAHQVGFLHRLQWYFLLNYRINLFCCVSWLRLLSFIGVTCECTARSWYV
jgi:hypothetical protein